MLAACGGGDDGVLVDAAPCMDVTHDEDADGVGDRCDICPSAPDPLQRDTTEAATMLVFPDGIGDACDPRPALSGDRLGAHHTFADPARETDWTGTGWTIANDRAQASDAARWIAKSRELGDGIFVQARLARLDWVDGGAFEIAVDGDGVGTGFGCAIARDRDGDGNDEIDVREVGGAIMTKSAGMAIDGAVITVTAWRTYDVQRRGRVLCRVAFDGGKAEVEIPTSDDLGSGIYGFAQQAATTDVTSIVVYTSPLLPVGND